MVAKPHNTMKNTSRGVQGGGNERPLQRVIRIRYVVSERATARVRRSGVYGGSAPDWSKTIYIDVKCRREGSQIIIVARGQLHRSAD